MIDKKKIIKYSGVTLISSLLIGGTLLKIADSHVNHTTEICPITKALSIVVPYKDSDKKDKQNNEYSDFTLGLYHQIAKIKDYYQEENGEGYAYAYAFPGMNRVLQSAGRVIRTEEDKGMILLIDDRFSTPFYRRMLPPHLIPEYLSTIDDIEAATKAFWESQLDGNNFN